MTEAEVLTATAAPAPAPAERVRMRKDDRRAAIIAEAIRIIGEQGYNGFSINDLARRCGLTTAGLLHHFVSKEGLLVALLEERDRRDREAVAGRLELRRGQTLSREQMLEVLHAIVANNAEQPHLVRLYAVLRAEALVQGHPARKYFADREKAVIELIAEIVASHVSDPNATAMQISALMYGLQVHWLREDCSFDLVKAWDEAAAKLLQ